MPAANAGHINTRLSTFASTYQPSGFIGEELCPAILVDHRGDEFTKRNLKDVITPLSAEIGEDGVVSQADYTETTDSYVVRDFGFEGKVTQAELDNADDILKPKESKTRYLRWKAELDREIRIATILQSTASYASANTAAAGAVWSNESTSDPIADMQAARLALAPGAEDETEIVVGMAIDTWFALRKHPRLLGLRSGGGQASGTVKLDEAAEYLGVDRIVVCEAQKNTANRGVVTPTVARIWDKTKVVLVRRPRGEVSGWVTGLHSCMFRLRKNGPEGWIVTEWFDPKPGVEGVHYIKVSTSETKDPKVIQSDQGFLLTSVM